MRHTNGIRAGGAIPLARICTAAVAALALAGCDTDSLLEVEDVDVVTPSAITEDRALPSLRAGAVSEFQFAYSGGGGASNGNFEGLTNLAGIFTDELVYISTFPTRIQIDQREIEASNSSAGPMFFNLQRARIAADRAAAGYAQFRPTSADRAEVLSISGYTLLLLAETYCNGVPLSTPNADGSVTYGAPETNAQLYERALAKFDSAAAIAGQAGATGATQLNLARVGRGRTLLNLGRFAEAAAAVTAVPTAFNYVIEHSENSTRQQNGTFALSQLGRRVGIANSEAGEGLPFVDARDPRVPVAANVTGSGTSISAPGVGKFASRTADRLLASGVEARLIEAEVALRQGGGNWLQILNALRTSPPAYFGAARFPNIGTLAPLADPGNPTARVDLLFRERAFWLYLTGHRLGDLRRLVRQYQRPATSVFPAGPFFRGGLYGPDVNFPIPFDEQNNPEFRGKQCLDRNA